MTQSGFNDDLFFSDQLLLSNDAVMAGQVLGVGSG